VLGPGPKTSSRPSSASAPRASLTLTRMTTRLRELATTTYSGLSSPFSARRPTSFVGERYGSHRQMTLPCPPIATMQLAFSVGVTVSLGALMLSMFLCPR